MRLIFNYNLHSSSNSGYSCSISFGNFDLRIMLMLQIVTWGKVSFCKEKQLLMHFQLQRFNKTLWRHVTLYLLCLASVADGRPKPKGKKRKDSVREIACKVDVFCSVSDDTVRLSRLLRRWTVIESWGESKKWFQGRGHGLLWRWRPGGHEQSYELSFKKTPDFQAKRERLLSFSLSLCYLSPPFMCLQLQA